MIDLKVRTMRIILDTIWFRTVMIREILDTSKEKRNKAKEKK
tara:strand:+ start:1447 stop:1572 length:126 start_codon:yes stop_codon:yes gene_type:complete